MALSPDLLWYPVRGQPRLRMAPDVLVALGRPKGYRGSYRQWEVSRPRTTASGRFRFVVIATQTQGRAGPGGSCQVAGRNPDSWQDISCVGGEPTNPPEGAHEP
jgi:hypothetical protein